MYVSQRVNASLNAMLTDPLAYRVICATRMYRALILYDMEVYGPPSCRD
jgi:hypothetical protein